MPPKAKRPRTTPSISSPSPSELLIAKCSRAVLERLVLKSLQSGAAIELADLKAANQPATPAAQPVVSTTSHLHGAGLFSLLPLHLLVQLLNHIGLEKKLMLAITVCKPLRGLRAVDALWTTIKVSPQVEWIGSNGLLRLLKWLPDPPSLKALDLNCSRRSHTCRPDEISQALALLPGLESIRVVGDLINKQVLPVSHVHERRLCPQNVRSNASPNVPQVLVGLAKTERPKLKNITLGELHVRGRISTRLHVAPAMPYAATARAWPYVESTRCMLHTPCRMPLRLGHGGMPT